MAPSDVRTADAAITWRPVLLLAALGVVASGCGGGGEEGPKPQMPGAVGAEPAAPAAEEAAAGSDKYEILGENPKWQPIKGLFEDYARRDINGLTNPMLANLVQFVERPVVEATELPETEPGATDVQAGTDEDLADPLRKDPLDRYQLIILVTGVPQPKAVVVDGQGTKHELVRGDAIGKEGGRVLAILQYRMLVSVPGKAKPVEVSIAPPLNEVGNTDEDEKSEL